jgi:hypothetical protein
MEQLAKAGKIDPAFLQISAKAYGAARDTNMTLEEAKCVFSLGEGGSGWLARWQEASHSSVGVALWGPFGLSLQWCRGVEACILTDPSTVC